MLQTDTYTIIDKDGDEWEVEIVYDEDKLMDIAVDILSRHYL